MVDKGDYKDKTIGKRQSGTFSEFKENNKLHIKTPDRHTTFTKISLSEAQILRLMSENVNVIEKKFDYNIEEYSDEGVKDEINLPHRRISIKNKTVKLLTSAFKEIEQANECNNYNNQEELISPFEKENEDEEADEYSLISNKTPTVIESEKIEMRKTSVKQSSEEDILNKLINRHYLDIVENFADNFEEYVVNNLTIIGYLDYIYVNIQKPSLSDEIKYNILKLNKKKKVLFLDLDETLIHSDFNNLIDYSDEQVSLIIEESPVVFSIFKRPYLAKFLEFANKNFNLILFTAGLKEYADAILSHIDPKNEFFHLRLYRESCIEINSLFIKDLSILTPYFDLSQMILVDNCIYSFMRNLSNGILVSSFYNDSTDDELLNLISYLENRLLDIEDIREVNEGYYGFDSIKKYMMSTLRNEGYIK